MFVIDQKSVKEVEKTLREWEVIKTEDDLLFFQKITIMSMLDKINAFGVDFMKITQALYSNFRLLQLKNEQEAREMLVPLGEKMKILLADTYLRMRRGQKILGL